MTLDTLTGNSAVIEILAMVIAALWAAFRASDWWRTHRETLYGRALEALSIGVEQTYQDYVRRTKLDNGGALSDEERAVARARAARAAIAEGARRGVDVMAVLGKEAIDALIEERVRLSKAEAGARVFKTKE